MMILTWLNATKNLWLIAIAAVVCIGAVAAYKNHEDKKIAAAVEATKATISASAVESATKTVEAEREAFDTTPLPASNAAILELCKRSASCRERGALK